MLKSRNLLFLNTLTSLLLKLVITFYGFIIPFLIISYYGSEKFGWLKSIIQFLSLISVCEFGIGAVIKSNLYKPLYDENKIKIAEIIHSSNLFFHKLAIFFFIYTIVLIFLFPYFHSGVFVFKDTALMIIIVSLGTFAQYFFGVSSQLLLEADRKEYVNNIIGILTTLIVTVSCYVIIKNHYSLLEVRIVYALVFSIRPLCLYCYTKSKYGFNTKGLVLTKEPIKQKWNGFSFHIAQIVQNNAGIMILSAFSAIENVSIYSVYHLVTNGLMVFINLSINSVTPFLGRVFASGNRDRFEKCFENFEWFLHCIIISVFSVCAIGIVPFIKIYTQGISDANYINWNFGLLMVISTALFCFSQLYLILISVTGKFKETEKFILIEPVINIIMSLLFFKEFGLIGVVMGAISSLSYKIFFLIIYSKAEILIKKERKLVKLILMDVIIVFANIILCHCIAINDNSYFDWFVSMLCAGGFNVIILLGVSFLLFTSQLRWFLHEIKLMLFNKI